MPYPFYISGSSIKAKNRIGKKKKVLQAVFPEVMTAGGVPGPRQWKQLPWRPDSGLPGRV